MEGVTNFLTISQNATVDRKWGRNQTFSDDWILYQEQGKNAPELALGKGRKIERLEAKSAYDAVLPGSQVKGSAIWMSIDELIPQAFFLDPQHSDIERLRSRLPGGFKILKTRNLWWKEFSGGCCHLLGVDALGVPHSNSLRALAFGEENTHFVGYHKTLRNRGTAG
jgi:hypothetical protein